MEELIQRLYERPEVRGLEGIRDINCYHDEANVLVHTRDVESALQKALEFDFVSEEGTKNRLRDYFSEDVGEHTRAELLRVATVLHDIAKAMIYTDKDGNEQPVMVVKDNGDTTCPEHAKVGPESAYEILIEEGFSEVEATYVRDVIDDHMKGFNLYGGLSQTKKKQKVFDKAKNKMGDKFLDVMIHTIADRSGCTTREDYSPCGLEFNGTVYENDVDFLRNQLVISMSIGTVEGNIAGLEQASQTGTVYLAPEHEENVRAKLTDRYTQQIQPKVDNGKIKAELLPGIVGKRVNSLISKLRFTDIPSDYQTVLAEQPIQYNLVE